MAFIVPLMSLVAATDRSVRVASGASRLCVSSNLFFELGLFIVVAPLLSDHSRVQALVCVLVTRALWQPHCRGRVRVEIASHAQAVAALITPERLAHFRAERSVAFAVIIALSRESLLRCDNRRVV